MESRRLDYDYKKKRQGKIPDEEIQVAQEKFNESKELSGKAMVGLLELDVSHLCTHWSTLHLQFTDLIWILRFSFFETDRNNLSLLASLDFHKSFIDKLEPKYVS